MSEDTKTGAIIIPLAAEEAVVTRRAVPGETVRVSTVTHSRDHLVDESLSHERIEVSHVPKGYEITAMPEIVQDGELTIVPIVEEVLVVQRKLILKEEVHIRRVRHVVAHRETVPLRHQEAVIERIPAADDNPPNFQPKD